MSGATFTFALTKDEASVRIRALEAGLVNLTPLHRAWSQDILYWTRESFRQEKAPDGTPWKKSKRAGSTGRGKTLQKTRVLYNSLSAAYDGRSAMAGTSDIRAGTHQFGAPKGSFGLTSRGGPIPWGDIPARPFLGMSDGLQNGLMATLEKYTEGKI